VVGVLLLIILIQNTQTVTLRLLFWKVSMSRIVLMPLTLLLGFAAGYATAIIRGKSRPDG
jgi:uncharacterized integral membrane protein